MSDQRQIRTDLERCTGCGLTGTTRAPSHGRIALTAADPGGVSRYHPTTAVAGANPAAKSVDYDGEHTWVASYDDRGAAEPATWCPRRGGGS